MCNQEQEQGWLTRTGYHQWDPPEPKLTVTGTSDVVGRLYGPDGTTVHVVKKQRTFGFQPKATQ